MTIPARKFHRFVVLGDSYSEGMTDEVIDGKFRGWADRVADVLAKADPSFTYANLAIRGKLVSHAPINKESTFLVIEKSKGDCAP